MQSLSISTSLKLCSLVKSSPFPKRQILDSFKLKELADSNLRFDGSVRKFSKMVENTVEEKEIAC